MAQQRRALARVIAIAASVAMVSSCSPQVHVGAMAGASANLAAPLGTITAHQLFEQADALSWIHGPEQERVCEEGDDACDGRFDVTASLALPGPRTVSENGTIVARIVNLGGPWYDSNRGRDKRYGVPRRSDDRHYVVVATRVGDSWNWSVGEAIRGVHSPARFTRAQAWERCDFDSANPNHPTVLSKFTACPHPSAGVMAAMIDDPRTPGWLRCTEGCCTAGPPVSDLMPEYFTPN